MYDVIIIGAGPAGLCAAVYTARAGLKTILFGVIANSNAYKAHIIENYWGYEKPITGPFLMEEGKKQALRFGAEFVEREITEIKQNLRAPAYRTGRHSASAQANEVGSRGPQPSEAELIHQDGTFTTIDSELAEYQSKSVIICSGLGFKPSGIKNEQQLTGKGVSFCVTCDGYFFKGKNTALIGTTNFAGEEALQLLAFTPNVTILSHGKDFEFSRKVKEALEKSKVKIIKTPKIKEFIGGQKLEKLKFADDSEMIFDGVFLALGIATAGDFANQLGLARTGPQKAFIIADPRTGETNVKGVYAAGDCTGGNAQAAKSSGEGCNAAISVIKLLKGVAAYVDYS